MVLVINRTSFGIDICLEQIGGDRMQKIQQQRYRTINGEIKVNCYKITLSKEVVKQAGFNEETKLEVRAENGKIIVEKGE